MSNAAEAAEAADQAAEMAADNVSTFGGLVDAFNTAAAANPLLNGLATAQGTVVTVQAGITALSDALADLAGAQSAVAELGSLDAGIAAALKVITDAGFTAPVTLDGFATATAATDLFVLGNADATIFNFSQLGEDVLFIGGGRQLVTLGTDQQITDRVGDVAALEVFAKQVGADTILYVENQTFAGNETGTANMTTITLTGVSAADLQLADGVFTVA